VRALLLIRHAEADASPLPGGTDDSRPLTTRGREQVRMLARRIVDKGLQIDVVVSSPLVRARDTASPIAHELGAKIRLAEELAPPCGAEDLRAVLREHREAALALVGHEPDLGVLAAKLTGRPVEPFRTAEARYISGGIEEWRISAR
jgi:phosphohistidine phosphatase